MNQPDQLMGEREKTLCHRLVTGKFKSDTACYLKDKEGVLTVCYSQNSFTVLYLDGKSITWALHDLLNIECKGICLRFHFKNRWVDLPMQTEEDAQRWLKIGQGLMSYNSCLVKPISDVTSCEEM